VSRPTAETTIYQSYYRDSSHISGPLLEQTTTKKFPKKNFIENILYYIFDITGIIEGM
jgi:hypothetical protein